MRLRFCHFLLLLALSVPTSAVVIKNPPAPSIPTLQQLAQKAGYIFSGTVLSVERVQPKSQNEVATVRITFRVDQAVRGVSTREAFTIHEWAGLWDSGDRYRRGEQVLLFLYQPSRLGLTSPVNGNYGRFKLDSSGRIMLNAARLQALRLDQAGSVPPRSRMTAISSRDIVRAIGRSRD